MYRNRTGTNVSVFVNTLTVACNSERRGACLASKPKGKKKPPWWSSDLNAIRKRSIALFNKAKFLDSEQSRSEYRTSLATKRLRDALREAPGAISAQISNLRKILSKTNPTLGYIKKKDQSWTTSSEEALDVFLSTHFPGCSKQNSLTNQPLGEVPINVSLLSKRNIDWAINSFQPYKSPGPDDITPAKLIHVGSIATNWLRKIFIQIYKAPNT